MPRWDRELAGRLISRHKVTHWTSIPTMVIDLFGSPNFASFDLSQPALPVAAAARRCRRRWPSGCASEFGLHVRRRLRPHRNRGAHATPTRPSAPSSSAWASRSSASTRAWSTPRRCRSCRSARSGEIVTARPDGLQGLLEPPRGHRGGLHRVRRQALLPHRRPRPHGRGRLLLHHRPPEADDQRQRLQGLAGRGRAAAVQAPGDPGGLRHRARATPTAARRSRRWWCCAPTHRGQTSEQDIIDWSREHMAAYKVPRIVQFVDALPK